MHPRDYRGLGSSFDIIGDVHGCADELEELFRLLGYRLTAHGVFGRNDDRTAVFVGDFADRGPRSSDVLRLVMRMVTAGAALAVPGNHDLRLEAYLAGRSIGLVHGLDTTASELALESESFRGAVLTFLRSLPSHLVLDAGRLVVAHTGLEEALHGHESPRVRHLAAWGKETTNIDPVDFDKRHPWLATYRGAAVVVFGHTPVAQAVWNGQAIDIDTGCVFGGRLTALRWPERTLVSVPARRVYAESARRFLPA
jgi:diadenosine tetraphosphatase ApaH/serine/threonine PP2A family protein phosphatase